MAFFDYVLEYFRGPQGEPGPVGPEGPTGPQGEQGPPGISGTGGGGVQFYIKEVTVPVENITSLNGTSPRAWIVPVGPDAVPGFADQAIAGGYNFNLNRPEHPKVVSSAPTNYNVENGAITGQWVFEGISSPTFTGEIDEDVTFYVTFVRRPVPA